MAYPGGRRAGSSHDQASMAGDRSEWTGICGGNSGDVLPTNSPPKDPDVRDNQIRLPPVGTICSCDSNQTVVLPVNQTPQIDCRSLKNPSHKGAALAIEMDRALYRFVSGRLSWRETQLFAFHNISPGCIFRSFGIESATLMGTNWLYVLGESSRKAKRSARIGDGTLLLFLVSISNDG